MDSGEHGAILGLVVRHVLQAKKSGLGHATVPLRLKEGWSAPDLIARKRHATPIAALVR